MIAIGFNVARRSLAALLCGALLAIAQVASNEIPPAAPKHQFFAGTVVELDAQHIKVSRTFAGRPTESHSFSIIPGTRLNKNTIKLRSRVIVRYRHETPGDVAIEVQLKPVVRPTKTGSL